MRKLLIIVIFGLFVFSCKKDKYENPYDDPSLKKPETVKPYPEPPAGSFAYLHKYIFKPTCANSGCHDGTFEPDFRTVYSSYNTLVNQAVISNDASSTYKYRVLPGNSSMSLIKARLTQSNIGSGQMPLISGMEWSSNKDKYIQDIIKWIDGGAKDMFGNEPASGNMEPRAVGVQVFPAGNTTTPYLRGTGSDVQPIEVPGNLAVDIWVSFEDDSTVAKNLDSTQIKLSDKITDFTLATSAVLSYASPLAGKDFLGNSTSYTHKTTVTISSYPTGTLLFLRVYMRDAHHTKVTETPNNGSSNYTTKFFTLKIK
jgi:hypothetical protein